MQLVRGAEGLQARVRQLGVFLLQLVLQCFQAALVTLVQPSEQLMRFLFHNYKINQEGRPRTTFYGQTLLNDISSFYILRQYR